MKLSKLICLLLACAPVARADEVAPPRMIDFTAVIMGLNGPMKDCTKFSDDGGKCIESVDLTLGRMCATAAAIPDRGTNIVDQTAHGKLAMKLIDAKEMALTGTELKYIEDQLPKLGYPQTSAYQAIRLLDPTAAK